MDSILTIIFAGMLVAAVVYFAWSPDDEDDWEGNP